MTNRYRSRQYRLNATDNVASAIDTAAQHPRNRIPASKTVVLDGDTGDRRLRGQQRAPDTHDQAGADAGRHQTGSAVPKGLHQVVSDEAERDNRVGEAEQQPDPAGPADIGLRSGEPERPDMRCQRRENGEQRHDSDQNEEQAVGAGDTEAEFEVPRQQQRQHQQGDRETVAHPVGAGGYVADTGRPGDRGRGGGGHRCGGRVVTLVAHVTISSLKDTGEVCHLRVLTFAPVFKQRGWAAGALG